MIGMGTPLRLRVAVTAALAAVATAACTSASGTADKAGGAGETVVLRMANAYGHIEYTPAVRYFVDRVQEVSGGRLRIAVVDRWGNFSSDAERQVVQATSTGKVDLGWVGARVFDTMGVNSFQALEAPMLIDSYALQDAVIRSDLSGEMLQGLGDLGVAGLAILADGLRKPVTSTKPLATLSDWHGIGFGTLPSEVQAQAIRSLGARPLQVFGQERDRALKEDTIQGFEMSLLAYQMNDMESVAPYVTANVNLWPQMDVLMINPARIAALTERDQRWLQQAATDATLRSTDLIDVDPQHLVLACKGGARFQDASPSDLAALHTAFAPVLKDLGQDSQTKAFIQVIQELKRSTRAERPLAIPEPCTGPAPESSPVGAGTASSSLNGTYRWTITKQDALASPTEDKSAEHLATFPWILTATLRDGTWTLSHTGGEVQTDTPGDSYSVQGDRLTFDWTGVGILTFTYTRDEHGSLHLKPVPPMDPGNVFVWTTHPWTKLSG